MLVIASIVHQYVYVLHTPIVCPVVLFINVVGCFFPCMMAVGFISRCLGYTPNIQ